MSNANYIFFTQHLLRKVLGGIVSKLATLVKKN